MITYLKQDDFIAEKMNDLSALISLKYKTKTGIQRHWSDIDCFDKLHIKIDSDVRSKIIQKTNIITEELERLTVLKQYRLMSKILTSNRLFSPIHE